MDYKEHSIEQTNILFFLTNTPSPGLQRKINIANSCGNVTVIYWNRANNRYAINPDNGVRVCPVTSSVANNKGLFRILAFLIYCCKTIPILLRAGNIKKVHVDYLDVLFFTCLFFWRKHIDLSYDIRDLVGFQYGDITLLNRSIQLFEKILLKRVSLLFLTSPYFWTEYYTKIFKGPWLLIENLPLAKTWVNFQRKTNKDTYVVGFIGSFRYYESFECLFTAVKELREQGYNISVYVAGTGPDEAKMLRLYSDFDYIFFHGSYEYSKEIANIYEKVDIVYSVYDTNIPNVRIALPNKFYECIICELPIIVSRNTSLEKYVKKYSSGYSAAYQNVNDLKKVLINDMDDDQEKNQTRNSLAKMNKTDFLYEKYTQQLTEVFTL